MDNQSTGFPQRNPIPGGRFGRYTAHHGKLALGDSRQAWVEGPDKNGRLCPVSSHWDDASAVRSAKEMAERDAAESRAG